MSPAKRGRGRPRRADNSAQTKKEAAAVGYVRVSTEEQAREGISLDAQEERIRAYCQLAELRLAQTVRHEGISGAKKLASRGDELTGALAGGAGHVVALKLDRLFRDAVDALETTKAWDKAGITLHLIDMGGQTVSTNSAMGRMMLTMMAGFAELERNLIRERTSAAQQHMKRRRKVYGAIPVGFARSGDDIVVCEKEAAVVAAMLEWRRENWTLQKICDRLERDGVRPFRGGKRWYPSTVGRILENNIHANAA
jgi:DNA invertase Pin-like site-specific DNA recombinase